MSKEISIGVSLAFKKTGAQVARSESITVDVTGNAFSHEVQSIGTSEEILAEGADLGNPGYMFIKNLDATNYVEVGTTGVYQIKLKAGEVALFRVDITVPLAIYAKANTASCDVEYIIIED